MTDTRDGDETNQYKFLEDVALQDVADDKLGHDSIAQTLLSLVEVSPTPFTIGLFGSWGTGKSSIVNFFIKKLRDTDQNIAIVEFDFWKYESDSLRRTFLKKFETDLNDQLFNKYWGLSSQDQS